MKLTKEEVRIRRAVMRDMLRAAKTAVRKAQKRLDNAAHALRVAKAVHARAEDELEEAARALRAVEMDQENAARQALETPNAD